MSDTNTLVFAFHPFRLDPAQRMLSREGQSVALTPKEFDTLLGLVEARGRVVDKEELIARVWPDSYVGDGSLARNISVLRKVLGDEMIETHRGRGYRITAPVVLVETLSTPSGFPPPEAEVSKPVPLAEPLAQRRWLGQIPRLAFATLAILFAALVLVGYLAIKSAKAHTSARATPIHSIVIQKEGAIDPLDEGFKLYVPDETPSPHAVYNRETNGWDRWRMVSKNQNYFYRPLSTEEKDFALQRDWKLTCICSLVSGAGFADIDFAGKGPRFDIALIQQGHRYFVGLTKQISPNFEFDDKIEFAGVADVGHPHTYELRYDHVSQTASLWIDGKQLASGYRGYHQFQEDRGLFFGAAIHGNASEAAIVFRRVRFEVE